MYNLLWIYIYTNHVPAIWQAAITFMCHPTISFIGCFFILRANQLLSHLSECCHLFLLCFITSSMLNCCFCLSKYLTENTLDNHGNSYQYSTISSVPAHTSRVTQLHGNHCNHGVTYTKIVTHTQYYMLGDNIVTAQFCRFSGVLKDWSVSRYHKYAT
jgi:hypothetical protein